MGSEIMYRKLRKCINTGEDPELRDELTDMLYERDFSNKNQNISREEKRKKLGFY